MQEDEEVVSEGTFSQLNDTLQTNDNDLYDNLDVEAKGLVKKISQGKHLTMEEWEKVNDSWSHLVGRTYDKRTTLSKCCLHRPTQSGIWGTKFAISIVASGGYDEDMDTGEELIYIGQGGNKDGAVVEDQELTRGNYALKMSTSLRNRVRVTRGKDLHSLYAPLEGYRYDGLYNVTECWDEKNEHGAKIYKFKLVRVPGQPPLPPPRPSLKDKKPKKIIRDKDAVRKKPRNNNTETDKSETMKFSCPFGCFKTLTITAEKLRKHLEAHKENLLNRLTSEEKTILIARNIINQGRIRSVVESYSNTEWFEPINMELSTTRNEQSYWTEHGSLEWDQFQQTPTEMMESNGYGLFDP